MSRNFTILRALMLTALLFIMGKGQAFANDNDSLNLVVVDTADVSSGLDGITTDIPETDVTPSGTLPILTIETVNRTPVTSKTEYIDATYWLDTKGHANYTPIGSAQNPLPLQIRGRGHSSWKGVKKPYKIKLAQKTSLMGMPKNKHWALLKPYEGTVAGLQLGELMGMRWSPRFRPVEVILNGSYLGLYFLTETVRIDENRVNIFEQQDKETNPDIIPGGWLVEIDNYLDDCQITIPECSSWNLTLRYHSPENLSSAQLKWLKDEFKSINAAVYSTDKTSTQWENYLDIESMARFFILQEVMDNPDGFHGSFYLHKDSGDGAKWIAGPIWDLSCSNREKTDYTFRMKNSYSITPHWIGEIIQYPNFCTAVSDVWKSVYPAKLSEIYEYIDSVMLATGQAWAKDTERWEGDTTQTAQVRADRIKATLKQNMEWFDKHLPSSPHSSGIAEIGITDSAPLNVYNLQGIHVGTYPTESEAINALEKGLYIINGKKLMKK